MAIDSIRSTPVDDKAAPRPTAPVAPSAAKSIYTCPMHPVQQDHRTGSAIKALLNLAPPRARHVAPGGDHEVPLDQVKVGDWLHVVPGDKVRVDGVVVEGHSRVEESMITGGPLPVEKNVGDKVTSGTVNGTGSFVMRADRVSNDTLLGQIVSMVAESQRSRAPIQGLADRVAGIFVPAVLAASVITFVVWMWLGPEPTLAHAIVNAVAVLIRVPSDLLRPCPSWSASDAARRKACS